MATEAITRIAASSTSPTSLILALHARYEQSFTEYNYVDRANTKLSSDDEEERLLGFRYQDAMKVMAAESLSIQRTILHQVPTTDEELTVLAYHIWCLFDPDCDEHSDADRKAIGIGLDNLFDYLVSEDRADMEKIGGMFTSGAMLAFERRRVRHAKLDLSDV